SAFRTFYQFLAARKGLRSNPVREVQLPKLDKKLPLVLTRQQIEELLAAAARCGDYGTVLQQRPAAERTGRSGCGRCGSLHGIGPRLRQRQKGTRLSGWVAGAGGHLALSCSGECSF